MAMERGLQMTDIVIRNNAANGALKRRNVLLFIALLALGLLSGVFISNARHDAFVSHIRGRLSQCQYILRSQVEAQGELPPTQIRPGKQRFPFSWRLSLLEFLASNDKELLRVLHPVSYDQRWDFRDNATVATAVCAEGYNFFTVESASKRSVHIYAVIGENSIWNQDMVVSKDLWEQSDEKLLLVAIPSLSSSLLEPLDLTEDQFVSYSDRGFLVLVVTVGGHLTTWAEFQMSVKGGKK